MIALDTNVLVRIVTRDDPDQVRAALEIMASSRLSVTPTVLLELEWVLRFSYEAQRETIGEVLQKLLGLRHLEITRRGDVMRACEWYLAGMDFADALHLALSGEASSFATFDRKLATRAAKVEALPQVQLLV